MSNSEKNVISSTVLLEPRKETENKHLYEPSKVSYLQDQVPQEIVIKIFSYFDIKELVKLAAVCRSWRDLIHGTPRFWWKAYLTLPCWRQRKLRKNVYSYAALYGNRCRDLVISCEHRYVNVACCEKLAIYLRNLLHLLHPTTLTSFKINDARLVCGKPSVRSSVIKILIGMLSRFDRLQCFAMPFAKFFYTEGIKVLKTVTSASKETLQSLLIEGFFHTPNEIIMEEPVSFDDVTKGILSLNNLKKLGIDFFVLTDDFVNALCTSSAKLEKLKINSSYITFSTKNISQISWLNLTKAFPKMKVEISITSIVEFPTISIPVVLEPVLPISKIRLDIRKNYHPNDEPNIGAVLRHISTHFSRSLVKFEMDIDNRDHPIDEVLKIFVQSCPHLLHLTVSAHFASPHTQQHVLDLIQARRLQQCKYPRKPRSQIREPPQVRSFSESPD
ncbi:uncharacterized protein LOC131955698 [Physella acuta]|uniref:uncharacterized protein LOC131955698 n=1 Tax=Physella acuta TaxID=109671 RepID=UPI0027DBAF63|nr:uncharacterized protein LOC131955698 [Physella acuta]